MSLLTQRIMIFALGIVLLVGGILRGDVLELWRRATQLCLAALALAEVGSMAKDTEKPKIPFRQRLPRQQKQRKWFQGLFVLGTNSYLTGFSRARSTRDH